MQVRQSASSVRCLLVLAKLPKLPSLSDDKAEVDSLSAETRRGGVLTEACVGRGSTEVSGVGEEEPDVKVVPLSRLGRATVSKGTRRGNEYILYAGTEVEELRGAADKRGAGDILLKISAGEGYEGYEEQQVVQLLTVACQLAASERGHHLCGGD